MAIVRGLKSGDVIVNLVAYKASVLSKRKRILIRIVFVVKIVSCLDIITFLMFLCKCTDFVWVNYIGHFRLFYFSIFSKGTWPRC